MKIGVITFWTSNDNYGQQLQLYALQKYLKLAGHESFLIHYDTQNVKIKKNPIYIRALKALNLVNVYRFLNRKKHERDLAQDALHHPRHFDEFRKKHIQFSNRFYRNFSELRVDPPDADCYIVGSDQVWNFGVGDVDVKWNYDQIHSRLLDFGKPDILRCSYAASWSVKNISLQLEEEIRPLLKKFDYISVREESGLKLCAQCGREDAEWVADPTLLLEPDTYREIYKEDVKLPKKPYLFLYMLNNGYTFPLDAAYQWAENHGMEVVYVAGNGTISKRKQAYLTVPEWIGYVDHAAAVLTNSFHCAVFATQFQKPFGVVPLVGQNAGMNSRMESLFKFCNLEKRYVNIPEDMEWLEKEVKPELTFDRNQFKNKLNQLNKRLA